MENMEAIRKGQVIRLLSITLSALVLFNSCYTTKTVNDTSRPIYKTEKVPVYEEVETIEYRKVQTPVFRDPQGRQVDTPIHLAVIDFYSRSDAGTIYREKVTESFYDNLISNPDAMNRFQLYSPANLKAIFEVNELTPHNRSLMREFSGLNIPFAVSAEVANIRQPEFVLSIYRTSNGTSLFSHQFKTTSESDAIADAIRFMIYEEVPIYGTERQIVRYDEKRERTGYHTKEEQVLSELGKVILILAGSSLLLYVGQWYIWEKL